MENSETECISIRGSGGVYDPINDSNMNAVWPFCAANISENMFSLKVFNRKFELQMPGKVCVRFGKFPIPTILLTHEQEGVPEFLIFSSFRLRNLRLLIKRRAFAYSEVAYIGWYKRFEKPKAEKSPLN